MKKGKKHCEKCAAMAPLLLRIMVGLLFVVPGLVKLQWLISGNADMLVGMLWGVTAFAWILAIVEVIAGGMIIAGYKQCVAAIPLAVILIGAIFVTKAWVGIPTGNFNLIWHLLGIAVLFQVHVASPSCSVKKK